MDDYDELDFSRDPRKESSTPILSENNRLLPEMRSRLVAGLKRYFVGKRLAGLLSIQGLRVLNYACDIASTTPEQPLNLWKTLEKGTVFV